MDQCEAAGDLARMKTLTLSQIILLTTLVLLATETLLIQLRWVRGHLTWRDSLASITMRVGRDVANLLLAGATVAVFTFVYRYRLFDISMQSPFAWAAIIVLDELAYYVFHRLSHECRFWWAAHVNHHSSQEYNLSTALRQTWTGTLAGTWAPWFPLLLLGFPPKMVFLQSGFNLLYQFWIHTETIRRMPAWFEYLFNSPSHHRVHHASNPATSIEIMSASS